MIATKSPQPVANTLELPPQALMEGDAVVAVVFEPHYAELFSQAPRMLSLVERLAAGECDFSSDENNDHSCPVCDAQRIVAALTTALTVH
jgi:hypothetical protein